MDKAALIGRRGGKPKGCRIVVRIVVLVNLSRNLSKIEISRFLALNWFRQLDCAVLGEGPAKSQGCSNLPGDKASWQRMGEKSVRLFRLGDESAGIPSEWTVHGNLARSNRVVCREPCEPNPWNRFHRESVSLVPAQRTSLARFGSRPISGFRTGWV